MTKLEEFMERISKGLNKEAAQVALQGFPVDREPTDEEIETFRINYNFALKVKENTLRMKHKGRK